ncbi:unnamed protein product, partial [Laminaria digitata]
MLRGVSVLTLWGPPCWDPLFGTSVWDPRLETPFGTPFWDPLLGPPFGTNDQNNEACGILSTVKAERLAGRVALCCKCVDLCLGPPFQPPPRFGGSHLGPPFGTQIRTRYYT